MIVSKDDSLEADEKKLHVADATMGHSLLYIA